jgi:hypothetical protein
MTPPEGRDLSNQEARLLAMVRDDRRSDMAESALTKAQQQKIALEILNAEFGLSYKRAARDLAHFVEKRLGELDHEKLDDINHREGLNEALNTLIMQVVKRRADDLGVKVEDADADIVQIMLIKFIRDRKLNA